MSPNLFLFTEPNRVGFTSASWERDVMEFRQLRYFVAIAEAGSLGKASERLRVAQPAVSLQLANLEARLGTDLFERYHRGVKLTQAGTLLLRHAKLILQAVADATQAVRGAPTALADAFRLGSLPLCRMRL